MSAMRTLYVLSSLEGWPDIMYQAIDSNTPDVVILLTIHSPHSTIKLSFLRVHRKIII